MPDALSKTVPIWCAVVNRAVCLRYPELAENWDTALYTPPSVVTKNEHEQIEKLLNNWAQDLQGSSYTIPKLTRPLRPIWLTPASSRFPDFSDNSQPFTPILCVSASRCIDEGMDRRSEGFVYIQGSGDDHELWGMGLTPNVFWKHRDIILSADRANIDSVIAAVVVEAKEDNGALRKPTAIQKVGGRLIVCSVNDLPDKAQSTEVDTALLLVTRGDKITGDGNPHFLSLVTPEGKKGQSYFLQSIIPQALAFIDRQLNLGACVCVACDDGKDLSIGIAVVALQRFFDEDGNFVGSNAAINPDKRTIRKRLEWIIADRPEANPSRATLKRVNEFLMSPAFIRPPAT
ncbi:tRNA A64-2'-O-ribosylphosphate transferase [Stygiomarasmius scandens]|uniref:tRNA A64-2'-O-ribosylphosphate transferase n=1 Tax=Marasmiellus scandens TaxID=2682957 RepID=A0ABR1K9M6_9AGAR